MSISIDYLHDVETRTTDEKTGGQKGVKLTQIGALDPVALIELGRVAGMGANKYAAFNYLRGFEWSKAYNAMQRHSNLWWAGEDRDPESGLPHIAHAAWMALALLSFALRDLGTDDRPPRLAPQVRDRVVRPECVNMAVTYLMANPGAGLPESWLVPDDFDVDGAPFPDHADMSCDEVGPSGFLEDDPELDPS